jgi:ribosomal protein L44E
MPYFNLYCSNERTYRWHTVDDVKKADNSILQSVIEHVKEDISSVLSQIKGITPEKITSTMEKYNPHILGIQTIYCPSCKNLQVDVIVDDQTKIREDLWRSYESNRVVNQLMKGVISNEKDIV